MTNFRCMDKSITRGLLAAVPIMLFLVVGSAQAAYQQDTAESAADSAQDSTQDVTPRSRADERRGGYEGVDDNLRKYLRTPRRRGGARRTLTESDVKDVILVANDVAPEWGASLQARLEENPDSLRESIGQNGRRLLGLAMLRERNPTLYAVKVKGLRCSRSLQAATDAYHDAVRDGRTEDAGVLKEEVRDLVAQSLDLELQARAMELAALDKALKDLKSALQLEIRTQEERLQERLDEVLALPEPDDPKTASASPAG